MLTSSYTASERLAIMIAEADVPDDVVFRMTPQDCGFNFELVKPYPGDVTFAHEDKIVLAFDEQVSESLAKFMLDLEFVGEEPNLFLTKQNENKSNE